MSIWAVTVGSNMARAAPLLGHEGPGQQLLAVGGVDLITSGSDARFALLGARAVGEETLNRFYVLHCVAIPLVAALPDGGPLLARAQGRRHQRAACDRTAGVCRTRRAALVTDRSTLNTARCHSDAHELPRRTSPRPLGRVLSGRRAAANALGSVARAARARTYLPSRCLARAGRCCSPSWRTAALCGPPAGDARSGQARPSTACSARSPSPSARWPS